MTIRPRSLVRWSVITWVATMGVCLYASQVWAPYERQNLLSVRHGGAESKGEGALRLVTVDAPGRSELATPAAKSASHTGKKGGAIPPSSGQLYEVTSYSHGCVKPRTGKEGHARRAADGRWPIADKTIAADPSIPFGTELLIEGLGFRTVGDRGSAIKGRRIDVFVDSCREALRFGRRWLRVYPVPTATSKEAEW